MVNSFGITLFTAFGQGITNGLPGEPYKQPATHATPSFGLPGSSTNSSVNPVPSGSKGHGAESLKN